MIWLFNPSVLPLLGAAVVCLGLLFIAGRYRHTPGSNYFSLLMLAMGAWTTMNVLEMGTLGLAGKRFWAEAEYLAIPYVPVFWLAFLTAYSGRRHWLTAPRLAALLALPAVTSVLAITGRRHGLVLDQAWLEVEGNMVVLARTFGGWFWVHTLYSYLLLAAGCALIALSLNRTPQWYLGQRAMLLLSCLIPWIGNALYLSGVDFLGTQLDPTPFLFTLSVVLLAWAVFYGRLFDVIPIGHDAVVQSLPDGVIILDRRDRVVEINPAACRLLGEAEHDIQGRPAKIVLGPFQQLVDRGRATEEILENVELDLEDGPGFFRVRVAPIRRQGRLVARLFVLQDTTVSRQAQADHLDGEKLKAALEMAGAVCHKLNQPIQGISGYAELLMLKMAPDDPLYAKIEAIKTQTDKMGDITNRLMGITRYRTSRYTSGETIVDIEQSSAGEPAEDDSPEP